MCPPNLRLRRLAQELRLQIAIDGPAGSGKSTVGRGLAGVLACPYLDTGLMYRAVTRSALQAGQRLDDGAGLARIADRVEFGLDSDPEQRLWIDGHPADAALHVPSVDAAVSEVSAHPEVREILVARQRDFAQDQAIVMVGRDIGTVVLPTAPLKLWVTASDAERARRRRADQVVTAPEHSEMLARLQARDEFDSSRPVSPLRPAEDVLVLDTSDCSAAEVLQAAIAATQAVADTLRR